MLAVTSYPKDFVDASRAAVDHLLAAYAKLTESVTDTSATAAFEPLFFNHMVLALDAYFLHRARGLEGKDGNPLNEVRVLCSSIRDNGGLLTPDKTIKLRPEASLLHLAVGDEIKLTAADFTLLADAFFAEIEKRYP